MIPPSYARKSAVSRGVRVPVLEPDGMSSRLLNVPTNIRDSLQGAHQTRRSSRLQGLPPNTFPPYNCPRSSGTALASPGNSHARHQPMKVQIVSGYSRSRFETYFIGDTNTFKVAKKKRGINLSEYPDA
jgi:hypothetical protein